MSARAVLKGSNKEADLDRLYELIQGEPENQAQEDFVSAWELTGFLAGDGFEFLFEQEFSREELAGMLSRVGFNEGAGFIERAFALVPKALLAPGKEELLLQHVRSQFDAFKALLSEYLEVVDTAMLPAFGNFVRQHPKDFEVG